MKFYNAGDLQQYYIEGPTAYIESIAEFAEAEDSRIHLKVGGCDYYASDRGIDEMCYNSSIVALTNIGDYKEMYIEDGNVNVTVLWNYAVFNLYYEYVDGVFKIKKFGIIF